MQSTQVYWGHPLCAASKIDTQRAGARAKQKQKQGWVLVMIKSYDGGRIGGRYALGFGRGLDKVERDERIV